jgi:hypothetical protein
MLDNNTIRNIVDEAPETVLSLYLHVSPGHQPNQHNPAAWQIFAKNTLRDIESSMADNPDWSDIRQRTETFLEGYQPTAKSLVLFVGSDGWQRNYDVPIAIENHFAFGAPDIVHLLWAIDEYERYLVVLVDSEQAVFHNAYLGRDRQSETMTIDFYEYDFGEYNHIHASRPTGGLAQGSGHDNFEDMKSEHVRRFHNEVATRIREIMQKGKQERIILGGNEQAAHEVKSLLHDTVKAQVGAIVSIPIQSETHAIADAISETANNLERDYELDLVNSVIDLAKSGGRGALGYDDIRRAFEMQQVELLILPYPMDDIELATELTLQALNLNSDIELVHGSAAIRLQEEGGLAARLYYVITQPDEA